MKYNDEYYQKYKITFMDFEKKILVGIYYEYETYPSTKYITSSKPEIIWKNLTQFTSSTKEEGLIKAKKVINKTNGVTIV